MDTVKILTVGSVLGSFKSFFTKVKAFDAKHGKFELVLATGDFFASPSDDNSDSAELIDLLEDKLEVPIQVLIMQGRRPLPQTVINKIEKSGGTICCNVFLLSKAGVFSTAHGLKIACLGGIYAPEEFYGKSNGRDLSNPYFTSGLLKQLLNQPALNPGVSKSGSLAAIKSIADFRFIDILVTNTWPTSITEDAATLPPNLEPELAPQLNELVKVAKPRYYFSSGEKFWEREPFCWPEENNRITRFVTLGDFAATTSGKKERWYYAVSISLAPPPSTPQTPPPNASQNPFLHGFPAGHGKRSLDQTLEGEEHLWGSVEKRFKGADTRRHEQINHGQLKSRPNEGYVCRICEGTDHFIRDCPKKRPLNDDGTRKPPEGYACRACASNQHYIKDCPIAQTGQRPRRAPREIQPDECWFCLSNPSLAKHLIVSIGNESYITLPKGQLPPTRTSKPSSAAPVPGGGHVLIVPIAHYPTLSSVPEDLWPPIKSDMEQIKSALRSCYAKYNASPVIFEVSRLSGKGGHAHLQVVPVPSIHTSEDIEMAFKTYGERNGIELEDDTENINFRRTENYFRVVLPNGKTLIHTITGSFDLQFGRVALANLLGVPQRMDWKECIQSEEEDKLDVEAFKKAFAPFDPLS